MQKKGESDSSTSVEQVIKEKENQKASLLKNFKVSYLENMLKSSTKSVAKDVVSTLIHPEKNEGALLQLTKHVESLPEYEEEADEEEKYEPTQATHGSEVPKPKSAKNKRRGS